MGNVRAILWHHLVRHHPDIKSPGADDPNELLAVGPFSAALQSITEQEQRELGASYVALWSRTFRTLVRHLRSQPERSLDIFAQEVLPYLRGDRLAARVEQKGDHELLVTDNQLPAAYLEGLVAGFTGLSGTAANLAPAPGGLEVRYRLRASDRAARGVRHMAQLRLPLLLTSVLAACVGIAISRHVTTPSLWSVAAVLLGTLSAQSGANAVHDFISPSTQHVLGAPRIGRRMLLAQLIGSYLVAAAAMAFLAIDHPGIAVYAVAGFGLGRLYPAAKQAGRGPWVAALTHGPLIVWGSLHALAGPVLLPTPGIALLAATPTGLLAAAMLHLDDLADRPLDQAAGTRTLVVRLPRGRDIHVLGALMFAALLPVAAIAATAGPLMLAAAGLFALAAWVYNEARRHADNPSQLALARSMLLGLYALTTATFTIAILRTL